MLKLYLYFFSVFFSVPFTIAQLIFLLFFLLVNAIPLATRKARRAAAGESVKFLRTRAVYSTSVIHVSTFFLKKFIEKRGSKINYCLSYSHRPAYKIFIIILNILNQTLFLRFFSIYLIYALYLIGERCVNFLLTMYGSQFSRNSRSLICNKKFIDKLYVFKGDF